MLWSGLALAESKPGGCDRAGAFEKVEGKIANVDLDQGKVSVRESDGKIRVFEASKETLQGFKVGDPIKAKLRSAPNCK